MNNEDFIKVMNLASSDGSIPGRYTRAKLANTLVEGLITTLCIPQPCLEQLINRLEVDQKDLNTPINFEDSPELTELFDQVTKIAQGNITRVINTLKAFVVFRQQILDEFRRITPREDWYKDLEL